MTRQIKILLLVLVISVAGGAGLWWFDRNEAQDAAERSQTNISGWQVFPAEGGLPSRVTNEQQGFSADALEGWSAVLVNSNLVTVGREDFPECSFSLRLGSNDEYLSASALTEQLNPYGPKPQEEHRMAGVIDINGWPAAVLTIRGLLGDTTREINIPKGNILFIVEMKMKGLLDEQKNFQPHPRRQECEDAFEAFLKNFQIGG